MTAKPWKKSIGSTARSSSVPHVSPAAIQTQLTWMAEKDSRAKAAKPEQFIDGNDFEGDRKERIRLEAISKMTYAESFALVGPFYFL